MKIIIYGHSYGRAGSVCTSARVDPGLVRTELGQLFDARWPSLSRFKNVHPVQL